MRTESKIQREFNNQPTRNETIYLRSEGARGRRGDGNGVLSGERLVHRRCNDRCRGDATITRQATSDHNDSAKLGKSMGNPGHGCEAKSIGRNEDEQGKHSTAEQTVPFFCLEIRST